MRSFRQRRTICERAKQLAYPAGDGCGAGLEFGE
jgi:hypothetical protein